MNIELDSAEKEFIEFSRDISKLYFLRYEYFELYNEEQMDKLIKQHWDKIREICLDESNHFNESEYNQQRYNSFLFLQRHYYKLMNDFVIDYEKWLNSHKD